MRSSTLQIYIEPTPNPNAQKFMLNRTIKTQGKSTYLSCVESYHNPLAYELFKIRGVEQVYFFKNVITITKDWDIEWEILEKEIRNSLEEHIENHNPDYTDPDPEKERREKLSPELQKIEEILDRTIRLNLQSDGGDVNCLSLVNNILFIRYQGACGTCPSSQAGTLRAIISILRSEYHPEIDVQIAPEY